MRPLPAIVVTILVLAMLPGTASAAPILTIQPIQICAEEGKCANPGRQLWEAEGDKIWAQAGIDLTFLEWNTVINRDWLNLSVGAAGSEFGTIAGDPSAYGGSSSATVISMWFADALNGGDIFGVTSAADLRIIAIGWDAILSEVRLDTMAHEIGHSLGLPHLVSNAGNNLMTAGQYRITPTDISDITPDGDSLDQLWEHQIAIVLQSDFVTDGGPPPPPPPPPPESVPEPGSGLLLGTGLVGLVGTARRRLRR